MRKLACGALAFSAAIFAANYILPHTWLILPSAGLAILGFGLILLKRRWLLGFEIAILSAAFGLTVFYVHSAFTAIPAENFSGSEHEISAVILDYPRVYEDYCSVYVRLTGEDAPKLKALLYDSEKHLVKAVPGQHISLRASVRTADTRYGEDYDYYYSKGIYLILNARSEIESVFKSPAIFYFPAYAKQEIISRIDTLFPTDTGVFMRSVMLGDKSGLYDDAAHYASLSRAGLMHVAAVSGMHMGFLAGLIQTVFGRGRKGSFICIPILWIFAAVSGASPSAIRAAFMLTVFLAAPILNRENDTLTSLSAILALILLFNPYAAGSVSLHLSFAAVAGLLCFFGCIEKNILALLPNNRLKSIFKAPLSVVSASLAVIPFTMPLLAIHFGSVSLLSPLSNVLALWAVSLVFGGGFVCCALACVLPAVAVGMAWLISWLTRYIYFAAGLVSGIEFAVVYLDSTFMCCWFVLSMVAIIAAVFIKAKPTEKLLYPVLLCALLFVEASFLSRWYYSSGSGTMAVLDVGQGQSLSFIGNETAAVVDCGGTGMAENAGELAAAYLKSRGVHSIDALVLTHLHSDHVNGVPTLMELVRVDNIYLPAHPQDDEGYLPLIEKSAARHGSCIHYIAETTQLKSGNLDMMIYEPADKGDANERCLMCKVTLDDFDMLITADADISAENELVEEQDISGVDVLIAGHHGSRYSCGEALLSELDADMAIISTGYNNYGHPTHETLERLAAYGYEIYRTDLNGTVEIRPQRQD